MRLFGVEIEAVSGDQQDWAVDTTLGLGLRSNIQETVKDHADVDTSLRLSTGSPSCSVSRDDRVSAKKLISSYDDPVLLATQISIQEYSNSNSNSDTTSTFYNNQGSKKRASEEINTDNHRALAQDEDDFVVYNPTPLRSYYPPMNMIFPEVVGSSRRCYGGINQEAATNGSVCGDNRGKSINKRALMKETDDHDASGLISSSVIPKSSNVRQTSEKTAKRQRRKKNIPPVPHNREEEALVTQLINQYDPHHINIIGTRPPQFLYSKCMQEADIKRDQNRVLLTTSQNLMSFLNEDEKNAVNAQGIELGAMDEKGNMYELRLKRWPSVNMFVLNKDWNKLTSHNQVNAGHWLHIWAYRRNSGDELRLVIVFKKTDHQDVN